MRFCEADPIRHRFFLGILQLSGKSIFFLPRGSNTLTQLISRLSSLLRKVDPFLTECSAIVSLIVTLEVSTLVFEAKWYGYKPAVSLEPSSPVI